MLGGRSGGSGGSFQVLPHQRPMEDDEDPLELRAASSC